MQAVLAHTPVAPILPPAVFFDDIIANCVLGDRLGLLERLDNPPADNPPAGDRHAQPTQHDGGEIDLTCYEVLSDDDEDDFGDSALEAFMRFDDILYDAKMATLARDRQRA